MSTRLGKLSCRRGRVVISLVSINVVLISRIVKLLNTHMQPKFAYMLICFLLLPPAHPLSDVSQKQASS